MGCFGYEKHVHFALTHQQANEDANVDFEIIQLVNAKLKDIKDGHKELADERQLWHVQVNS